MSEVIRTRYVFSTVGNIEYALAWLLLLLPTALASPPLRELLKLPVDMLFFLSVRTSRRDGMGLRGMRL
jgi:hypothetical protein